MQYEQLKYVREEQDPSLTIETQRLVVKVIDNTGLRGRTCRSQPYFRQSHVFTPFTHHLGYHGIRTLYDKVEKRNLVVPFVSWLNLQAACSAMPRCCFSSSTPAGISTSRPSRIPPGTSSGPRTITL